MKNLDTHSKHDVQAKGGADVDVDAEHKPAVSRKASNASLNREASQIPADQVHAAAAQGTAASQTALPFQERIQASFGAHDISGVKAHVGGQSRDATQAMGAQAYASGDHVVFGQQPDLHTAAHEVAHVVQQQKGVQLYGGVGKEGDAYERNADEVADRVVAGKPAGDLLGPVMAQNSAQPSVQQAVQRKEEKEPTKDEKEHQHTIAKAGTYDSLRSEMMLASKEFHAAARAIENAMKGDFGDAGAEPAFEIFKTQFSHADSVARHVSSLAKGLDNGLYMTDTVYTQHLAPEFHAVWGGFKDFKTAMDNANNFASSKNHSQNLNPFWIKQELDGLAERFGGVYKGSFDEATWRDGNSGDSLDQTRDEAIHNNLDAALESGKSIAMGASDSDIGRMKKHVTEAAALLKEIEGNKKALAKHKPLIAQVVKEYKAVIKDKPIFKGSMEEVQSTIDHLSSLSR